MKKSGAIIRRATRDDVAFVAECVLASVDLYDFKEESIEKDIAELVCGREDTLYSYRNAEIAVLDGVPAGCLVSYDGASYLEARRLTFKYFRDAGRSMDESEMETGPGEYYLDSMAVKPEFRGLGIGLELLWNAVRRAQEEGFERITLLVSKDKPELRKYYSRLGFIPKTDIYAFGESFLKMSHE